MGNYTKRPTIAGQRVRKVTVAVDLITDCAIKVKTKLEGKSYSAALCELTMTAALNDPVLVVEIKRAAFEGVRANLIETGYHEGLAHALASNFSTAPKEGVIDDRV